MCVHGGSCNVDPDLRFEIAWHMSVQISDRGGTCRTNQVQCLAFALSSCIGHRDLSSDLEPDCAIGPNAHRHG